MNLCILSATTQDAGRANYRGIDRPVPGHCSSLPDDHVVSEIFRWLVDEMGDGCYVHDIERAKLLVDAYSKCEPPQYFEIVEVTADDEPPKVGREFLGYDLVCGSISLIVHSLVFPADWRGPFETSELSRIAPLMRLLKQFFCAKLNANDLFEECHTAQSCLDCMRSLQATYPNLFEGDDMMVDFSVLGLYAVPGTPSPVAGTRHGASSSCDVDR